jgi:hypothetical protein
VSNRLDKKVLLEWLDNWRDFCREDCIKEYCADGMEKCEQAYTQIVARIKSGNE